MFEYKPSSYVTWIKHLSDYTDDSNVIVISNNYVKILVHPAHDPLVIDYSKGVYQEVDKEDKTVQLYFYSLTWVVPILISGDSEKIAVALDIINKILDVSPKEEREGSWNMLWDDHAICERLCVLLELKKNSVLFNFDDQLLIKVDVHSMEISRRLNGIIEDDKWKNNNHRIFHLLANFIYACECESEVRKNELKDLIEDFIGSLIDSDTGFALEQSIAYCFFDLVVVKNVIATMSQLSANLKIDAETIERNLNVHMAALSFPDGSLPASGDTTLGRYLSDHQKKYLPDQNDLATCWGRLDKIGYYRGCSDDGSVHYLTLAHNAESAHGHYSPLHTDIWFQGFGFLLVDAGGPYKYGTELRYTWFRAARGHNSLAIKAKNQQELIDLSIDPLADRAGLVGTSTSNTSRHHRSIFTYADSLMLHEAIFSEDEWEVYYNFSEGCAVKCLEGGIFLISRAGCSSKIFLKTNADPSCLRIVQTERCTGHSELVFAPSLVVSPSAFGCNYYMAFQKF